MLVPWTTHLAFIAIIAWCAVAAAETSADRPPPNIVWITSEDHGPHLGCYGDSFAATPNIDGLAAKGVIYARVWSCAPVCAPARTTLISGLYPCATASEHMRSMVAFPSGKEMFPRILRRAGYYCTNNVKEDYNLTQPGKVWDESSRQAHWHNRPPGMPFFAVFNSTKSHESQIRTRPHKFVHDPAMVRVPAYHPDTPEVRRDWAQYYDMVTQADADAGRRLRELEAAGLMDETIIFYFADHGSGMPRNKRSACNSGLHVPLVVYIPGKYGDLRPAGYEPGGKIDRLVSFIDFAPTMLSLAGIETPGWMQGGAFLGAHASPPSRYAYGFRGRMDERYDLVRSVTDGRYVYVRNYHPHRPHGQHVSYMFQTPTTQVWRVLHLEGKLNIAQDAFWNAKAPEELYDLTTDPDEVVNLAASEDHQEVLKRLREAHHEWVLRIRDLGFLPEGEIFSRSRGTTPYDMGQDESLYPLQRIFAAADAASSLRPAALANLRDYCKDADSAIRYWGVMGLRIRGQAGYLAGRNELTQALEDKSPYVRIAAAEALCLQGDPPERERAHSVLLKAADWPKNDVFISMTALNSIDALGPEAAALKAGLRESAKVGAVPHPRYASYVPRLLQTIESP